MLSEPLDLKVNSDYEINACVTLKANSCKLFEKVLKVLIKTCYGERDITKADSSM